MELAVEGSGVSYQCLGVWVFALGFSVPGFWFRVDGSGTTDLGLGFGFTIQGSGIIGLRLGFVVLVSRLSAQGLRFTV